MSSVLAAATSTVQKRPVPARAFILEQPATFVTSSGEQHGTVGDVVIIAKDHAWPVSPQYFAEHYDVLKDQTT
jgi:hypothetical protein